MPPMNNEMDKKPVLQYKIKAVTTGGFCKVANTNDYAFGEAWMHVMARALEAEAKPNEDIIITMFDMTVKRGSNIVAQYEKTTERYEFKSFVSDTLMLQPVTGKEIFYEE